MAWVAAQPAGSTTLPNGAEYIRNNNSAVQVVLTAARLAAGTVIPSIFVTGGVVKSWFYSATAPTNWTEVALLGDTLLAIKGGTTYTTGGATAGTWTQPDHKLLTAEMPKHAHEYGAYTDMTAGPGGRISLSLVGVLTARKSTEVGADGNHHHGDTYRPAARVGLVCSLN